MPLPRQRGVGTLHYSLERVEVEIIELVFAGMCGWLIQTNYLWFLLCAWITALDPEIQMRSRPVNWLL